MVVEEVRRQEETARHARAVALVRQGHWMNWEKEQQLSSTFVREGDKPRTSPSAPDLGPLKVARDWQMQVDLDQRLIFPTEIVTTTLRPDLVLWSNSQKLAYLIELMVPWEEAIEEAIEETFERKKLRYANLAAEAEDRGWKIKVHPVEVGCRGFVATSGQLPSTQPNVSNTSWISNFSVPWEKMPTRLSQALASGGMAHPEDRRIMIRTVVEEMRVHCPNPNRAAFGEVARAIVSKYPATFADKTAEGEQLGCGYYSLLKQLKTRVEHVNRDNVSSRIRQPRKRSTRENNEGDVAIKRARSELDSYGCINWQPTTLPEGETTETLETKRQTMSTVFRSAGPQAIETTDVNTYMSLTYIYQRHMLNSWPAPTLCEVQEHWPFLFTKRGLCTHFHTLTDIEVDTRLSEALLTKGRRILNFFQSQRLQWNKEIEHLLRECDSAKLNHNQIVTAAILLLMKYFQEKEDSIFILADAFSTKMSVEREMTLPITPRVIALGNNFMSASRWMVSLEGKVFYEPEQMHDFASTLAVFFASYYVFNLEYQESASITLEMIQRFFVRINPDMGTKCPAKLGTSRKTGRVVKRKVTSVSPRITTFLQRLSEFEWRTSN
ncbi:uncharacterized protein LOC134624301 [Pelmatolapia mariae]|uniref:uncharacterized protein LOC134624301 n=1 Tax=Pelmatolapia mariae TaxID=158779 RepID=UPI002FE61E2C